MRSGVWLLGPWNILLPSVLLQLLKNLIVIFTRALLDELFNLVIFRPFSLGASCVFKKSLSWDVQRRLELTQNRLRLVSGREYRLVIVPSRQVLIWVFLKVLRDVIVLIFDLSKHWLLILVFINEKSFVLLRPCCALWIWHFKIRSTGGVSAC